MITTVLTLALLQNTAPTATPTDPVPLAGPRTLGLLDADRFDRCHDAAIEDPAAGIAAAQSWLIEGGGYIARQCLGFAEAKAGRFDAAAASFAQAASDAEVARDWRAANLWAQAGNAALAAGNAVLARRHLDAALAQGRLTGVPLGEAHLDRARAALAQEDWPAARADLDLAQRHAAQDPLVWLLSATFARRQNDLVRAQADIAVAAQLGPRDAAIALEAGNIAVAAGEWYAAERSWTSTVALAPDSPQGQLARARLEELQADRYVEEQAHRGLRTANPALAETPVPVLPQSR